MLELKLVTEKVKRELDVLEDMYESGDKDQVERSREFFEYVKQDSKPLFELIERWYHLSLMFLDDDQVTIYEEQIEATKENFEMLILHSYYIDIRKRRYVEMNRSCLYVFDQLLKGLV